MNTHATDTLTADILAIRAATCSDAARIAVRAMEERDKALEEVRRLQDEVLKLRRKALRHTPDYVVEDENFGITADGNVFSKSSPALPILGTVEDELHRDLARLTNRWEEATRSDRLERWREYDSTRGVIL